MEIITYEDGSQFTSTDFVKAAFVGAAMALVITSIRIKYSNWKLDRKIEKIYNKQRYVA